MPELSELWIVGSVSQGMCHSLLTLQEDGDSNQQNALTLDCLFS